MSPITPTPSAARVLETAAAWATFRRLLAWCAALGVAAGAGAVGWVAASGAPVRLHMVLAMGGGIFLALVLGGALMGLVFLSNRLGHDDEVARFDVDDL